MISGIVQIITRPLFAVTDEILKGSLEITHRNDIEPNLAAFLAGSYRIVSRHDCGINAEAAICHERAPGADFLRISTLVIELNAPGPRDLVA